MDGNLLVNRNSSLKVITKEPRPPDWVVSIHVPGTLFLHGSHDSDDNNHYLEKTFGCKIAGKARHVNCVCCMECVYDLNNLVCLHFIKSANTPSVPKGQD